MAELQPEQGTVSTAMFGQIPESLEVGQFVEHEIARLL